MQRNNTFKHQNNIIINEFYTNNYFCSINDDTMTSSCCVVEIRISVTIKLETINK